MRISTVADYIVSLRMAKLAHELGTPPVAPRYQDSPLKAAYEALLEKSGSSLPVKGVRMQPPKLPVMSAGIMGRAPLTRKTAPPPVKDPTPHSSAQKAVDGMGVKKSPLESPKLKEPKDSAVYGDH